MKYTTGLLGYVEFDVIVDVSDNNNLRVLEAITMGVSNTINIGQGTFELSVDSSIQLPSVQATASTITLGQTADYTLRFFSSNPSDLAYISQGGSHQVTVSISAWVSSGIYSGWVTSSSSNDWSWSTPS
jgi:hypothetical protein